MEVPVNIVLERRIEGNAIHFEPGMHPRSDSENSRVYTDFNNGNVDAHGWNKEVGERIASYAYNAPALLLTIDGLEPNPPSPNLLFNPLQEAVYTWIHLPARPNKLNHTGKVYVLKGDTDHYNLPQAILPQAKEPLSLQQQMDTMYKTDAANANQVLQKAIGEETAGIAALGLALWGASKLLVLSPATQKMSRRQFLSKAIGVTTAAMVGGSLLRYQVPNIAAVAANEPTKEFLQTVANVVRPRLSRPAFYDGRTALLLAKAADAQAAMGEPSQVANVVVMGSAHADMVPTYNHDTSARNTAIAIYAKELLDVARQVYSTYYHISPNQTPPQAINSLLNYVTQTDIVEVSDPGGPPMQPSFPNTVERQMHLVKSFNSPQVEEAIRLLRPQ